MLRIKIRPRHWCKRTVHCWLGESMAALMLATGVHQIFWVFSPRPQIQTQDYLLLHLCILILSHHHTHHSPNEFSSKTSLHKYQFFVLVNVCVCVCACVRTCVCGGGGQCLSARPCLQEDSLVSAIQLFDKTGQWWREVVEWRKGEREEVEEKRTYSSVCQTESRATT